MVKKRLHLKTLLGKAPAEILTIKVNQFLLSDKLSLNNSITDRYIVKIWLKIVVPIESLSFKMSEVN